MPKILIIILDILFPKYCLGCGTEGTWICRQCYEGIELINQQCCPVCRKINDSGQVCPVCQKKSHLNGLIIATSYKNKIIKTIIHYFKYQFIKELSRPLAILIIKKCQKNKSFLRLVNKQTIIISIPLHQKRLIERGYNQSSILAEKIAKKFNLRYHDHLVKRKKKTDIQATLSKKERKINLSGAFSLNRSFNFHGKNVIILDDVATTLSTLNSCAGLLKKAGAKEIWGLVIARGDFK